MLTISKPSRQIKTYIVLLVVVALAGLYSNAVAMRCGTKLVELGDNHYEVAVKCGEPTFVEQNRWHTTLAHTRSSKSCISLVENCNRSRMGNMAAAITDPRHRQLPRSEIPRLPRV